MTRTVECGTHGTQIGTIVCQHLAKGEGLGWNYGIGSEPDARFPDAWCDSCDRERRRQGGWTDDAVEKAALKIACAGCYIDLRSRNWPSKSDAKLDRVLDKAREYLHGTQDEMKASFNLDAYPRWDWTQDDCKLFFTGEGLPTIEADIQIVGSIATNSASWLWSWGNSYLDEPVKERIREVRAYGDSNRMQKLACAYWLGNETDGWDMTAVAALFLGAKGAYRTPYDGGFTYMVMTRIAV